MKRKPVFIAAAIALASVALVASGVALYRAGKASSAPQSAAAGQKAGQTDPATGQTILYYHDPMVPGTRFDAPGKSPFMDMMLVPVYGGASAADASGVTINPRIQQSLGLRTAEVVEGVLKPQLAAVGSIAWNERDQSVLQARAAGIIEKLQVRATLDRVTQGQPFAELYVPEWVAAQEEYLAVKRIAPTDAPLIAAARQRMALVGMTEAQIARVAASQSVQARVTLTAPSSGVVAELIAREGMVVALGATLARINGLTSVWALAELPESQAALVRVGDAVEARSPGVPGAVFRGSVQALLPEVNPSTRTRKARVQLANPLGQLVPGQFVNLQFTDARATKALLIPSEAVIQTGQRTLVMLAEAEGKFVPVEVEAGQEMGGQTEIRRGLTAGQRVVVSSQFLIDSEASLKGVEARMNAGAASSPSAAGAASGVPR